MRRAVTTAKLPEWRPQAKRDRRGFSLSYKGLWGKYGMSVFSQSLFGFEVLAEHRWSIAEKFELLGMGNPRCHQYRAREERERFGIEPPSKERQKALRRGAGMRLRSDRRWLFD